MQTITPSLWYDNQAEEASGLYCSIFKNSRILQKTYYDEAASNVAGMPLGSVMTVLFELEGQRFMALNGGPIFTFTPAISFMVECDTQEEIDHYWNALTAMKEAEQCGWLMDKFGVSWQIVPRAMGKMLADLDKEKVRRMTRAMLNMKKLDIARLEKAFDGK
jgi:predicted 3-demethylubiquinone-9 3-methyltransferase (glyoxalase superfamily)